MEYGIVMVFAFLFCLFLYNRARTKERDPEKNKSNITKLDDKNWIVNNELISFEEDTPLLRYQQKSEDRKHYQAYEKMVLQRDIKYLSGIYYNVKKYMREYPDEILSITEKEIIENKKRYNNYKLKCEKLHASLRLNEKEYSIMWRYGFLVHVSGCGILIQEPIGNGCYNIFNKKTAKYANGDMKELIAKEFKEKYY